MTTSRACAPVRICDVGGWTDTWFGGPGRVLNVAAGPGVEVTVNTRRGPDRVMVDLTDFGDRYQLTDETRGRHTLIDAAVDHFQPAGEVDIRVSAAVPPGSGVGTSASVAVALVGGLAATSGQELEPAEAARLAHHLESDMIGTETGVQDQIAAGYGGINYITIDDYPGFTVETLSPWPDLADRLAVIFLGLAHHSSEVHRLVIESAATSESFDRLREAARRARNAVLARDLDAFASAMIENTAAQEALHPDLVGSDARRVIATARSSAAAGWKINGAGGEGGSLTVLSQSRETRSDLVRDLLALDARYRALEIMPTEQGLTVEVT